MVNNIIRMPISKILMYVGILWSLVILVSCQCNTKYGKCIVVNKQRFRVGEIGSPDPGRIGGYYGIQCEDGRWFSDRPGYETYRIGDTVDVRDAY